MGAAVCTHSLNTEVVRTRESLDLLGNRSNQISDLQDQREFLVSHKKNGKTLSQKNCVESN